MHLVKPKTNNQEEVIFDKKNSPSFISGWYIEDMSICDRLIKEFNLGSQYEGCVNWEGDLVIDKSRKDAIEVQLPYDNKVAQEYYWQLDCVLKKYLNKYPMADKIDPFDVSSMQIQKYPKGGGFHLWHKERDKQNSYRYLVFMTYLNDIESGGETEFFHQNLKIKPQKGLTIIWPVDWTHTHKGNPAPVEEKYIITGWYTYKEDGNGN